MFLTLKFELVFYNNSVEHYNRDISIYFIRHTKLSMKRTQATYTKHDCTYTHAQTHTHTHAFMHTYKKCIVLVILGHYS